MQKRLRASENLRFLLYLTLSALVNGNTGPAAVFLCLFWQWAIPFGERFRFLADVGAQLLFYSMSFFFKIRKAKNIQTAVISRVIQK